MLPTISKVAYGWALSGSLLSRLVPLWQGAKSLQWSIAQIIRCNHDDLPRLSLAAVSPDFFFSAIDCNIDLLDSLTLSVLVAQTARDLKKSPRKLLFKPSAAALILLLRVVSPMLTATFLADLWFAHPPPPTVQLLPHPEAHAQTGPIVTRRQVRRCCHSTGHLNFSFVFL